MTDRAFHRLDPRSARQRLLCGLICTVIAWFAVPDSYPIGAHVLIAWDAGALVQLGLAAVILLRTDARETRRRAAAEDPGRTAVWLFVLGGSTVSLFGAAALLQTVKTPDSHRDLVLILCIATVVIAWFLTNVAFTLRYAHLYYRGAEIGGLSFPGDHKPDDLDFAYFAFTIGMCFQVSDIAITSRAVRRTVLLHAILAFSYNTGILALVLNIVMSQLG